MITQALFIELLQAVIVIFSCVVIAKHTRCLYSLSMHKGIAYFTDAYIFWGIGFFLKFGFALGILYPTIYGASAATTLAILQIGFEYFLILGGFFLVHSLIWRQIDELTSSVFTVRYQLVAIHALAFALALTDYSLATYHFLFVAQLLALGYASILTYDHWMTSASKSVHNTFASLYLVAICSAFMGYVVNYIAQLISVHFPWVHTIASLFTIVVFILVLFGVLRIMHSSAYCERCCRTCVMRDQTAHANSRQKNGGLALKKKSSSKKKNGKKTRTA